MVEINNELTQAVIGAGISVHRELGPGLLESAYQFCLAEEFRDVGLSFQREISLPVVYRGVKLECGYRLDFVVENHVVVEVKAMTQVLPIHHAQVISYLRLSQLPVGLLINFHELKLTDGVKRFANT